MRTGPHLTVAEQLSVSFKILYSVVSTMDKHWAARIGNRFDVAYVQQYLRFFCFVFCIVNLHCRFRIEKLSLERNVYVDGQIIKHCACGLLVQSTN
jgi:hypothetical protein